MTKDEPVDLFLKETENTPDGDFAAQLDLSVVRCDAPDGRAPKGLYCCVQGGRRGRQRRSSPAPSALSSAPRPCAAPSDPHASPSSLCAHSAGAHTRERSRALGASGWCRRTDPARCAKRVSEYEAGGGCMQRSNRRSCTTSALHSTRSGRAPRARRSSTRSTATRCRCGQFQLQCAQCRCRCGCIQDGTLSIDEFLAFFGQLVEKLNDQQVNKGLTVRCRCRAHPMRHGFPRGIE